GTDSSLIAALMQSQSERPVKTFTLGTWSKKANEADHAKAIARALGSEHLELYIDRGEAVDVVPQLADIWDEPFADTRQIGPVLASRLASRSVRAVVRGEGGDELFGGHQRYVWGADLWNGMRKMPAPVRSAVSKGLKGLSTDQWDALAAGLGRVT